MAEKKCADEKAGTACRNCAKEAPLLFWCEVCEKTVEEKRCPSCGLKTRKIR
jgi:predicted RNA-binding protein with PUA domain